VSNRSNLWIPPTISVGKPQGEWQTLDINLLGAFLSATLS
jgi:hypothetical protein